MTGRKTDSTLATLVKKKAPPLKPKGNSFLYTLVAQCTDATGGVFDVCKAHPLEDISLHLLSLRFGMDDDLTIKSYEMFIDYITGTYFP